MTSNKMKLMVPSRSVNEGFVRAVTAAFAAQADPPCDVIADIKTAVSEAVTNCIVHAYPDRTGDVYISAELAGSKFKIKISDKGCGIANVEAAVQPLFTTAGPERSGLGFTVMQSFMDKFRVRSRPGKGTCVTMVKELSDRDMRASGPLPAKK